MAATDKISPLAQEQNNPELGGKNVDAIVGDNIRQLRVRINKTQAEIAQILDISAQQYQKYEKGTTKCSIASLLKLADFYKCDVSLLLPTSSHIEMGSSNTGFQEDFSNFPIQTSATIPTSIEDDEAAAVSAMLAVLIRIPDKSARRRVLEMLSKIV